ncbi:hypothetical protein MNBD_GAMMA06-2122 [hydrothermal vent metagenome]|uniref:DUF7931 domain-containing protein n=1 Tax=hydrothermal vent metagenome TaxID=652676 RepID=A0A3B0W7T5_9ZZZZ
MNEKFYELHKLGETLEEIHINTSEENKNAAIALTKQARHSIDIFSQDMDAIIYNNKNFERSIFNLAKRHPNTKIRILTQNSKKAVQNGHRLIKLAQSITSSVFINNPSREYKDEKSAFLIVDKLGLLYRPSTNNRNYKASLNFMAPQRAGKLLDYFNKTWEHSTPDLQVRRIYI